MNEKLSKYLDVIKKKYLEDKKQKYLKSLYQVLDGELSEYSNAIFNDMYIRYAKFCYHNNLSLYDHTLTDKSKNLFIVESKPIDYDIDNNYKLEALERLKIALTNIQNGYVDGISPNDVTIILESVIQNARVGLAKNENDRDFFASSLSGACGYSQALTVYPLLELGVKVTINNVCNLPDSPDFHAFATCTLPIKDGDQVYEKQFLLDATYRQFFLMLRCNEGRLYEGNNHVKDKTGIDPGYYVCQSNEGVLFAQELLKKGYIELTEETARLYGYSFSAEAISISTPQAQAQAISSHSGLEYISAINDPNLQRELDYDIKEFEDWDINISLFNKVDTIERNMTLN